MAITRTLTVAIKEKAKYVRIIGTGTQFQGSSPANITLQAKLYGITAKSYAWYRGSATTVVGTNQNFIIANNQVDTVETYKIKVTSLDNQTYEDTISITKVISGGQGKPGKIPIQREWKVGDVYRNNDDVIDYIYHRATNTWWRLKDGYSEVIASVNPSNAFVQLTSMEQLAVQLIVAEQANLAGFIFKDNRLVSQNPSPNNPNLVLDGVNGSFTAKRGKIGMLDIYEDYLENEKDHYKESYRISLSNAAETRVVTMGEGGPRVIPGYSSMSIFRMEDRSFNMSNVGIIASAANGKTNHALYIEHGDVAGFGVYTVMIENSNNWYQATTEGVILINGTINNHNVYLPKDFYCHNGRQVTIKHLNKRSFLVHTGTDAKIWIDNGWVKNPGDFGKNGASITFTFYNNTWYVTSTAEW